MGCKHGKGADVTGEIDYAMHPDLHASPFAGYDRDGQPFVLITWTRLDNTLAGYTGMYVNYGGYEVSFEADCEEALPRPIKAALQWGGATAPAAELKIIPGTTDILQQEGAYALVEGDLHTPKFGAVTFCWVERDGVRITRGLSIDEAEDEFFRLTLEAS